jgi:hypothetical protein
MNEPSQGNAKAVYRAALHVRWVIDNCRIQVVDEKVNRVRQLDYPEAAIWDFVSRGRSLDQTLQMLCAIYPIDTHEAERMVRLCLQEWVQDGLVMEEAAHG